MSLVQAVAVQFSGKATTYNYLVEATDGAMIAPGQRVVVPNKLKDDGTLAVSIATVVELHTTVPADAELYIVQPLAPDRLYQATERAKLLAAKEAA